MDDIQYFHRVVDRLDPLGAAGRGTARHIAPHQTLLQHSTSVLSHKWDDTSFQLLFVTPPPTPDMPYIGQDANVEANRDDVTLFSIVAPLLEEWSAPELLPSRKRKADDEPSKKLVAKRMQQRQGFDVLVSDSRPDTSAIARTFNTNHYATLPLDRPLSNVLYQHLLPAQSSKFFLYCAFNPQGTRPPTVFLPARYGMAADQSPVAALGWHNAFGAYPLGMSDGATISLFALGGHAAPGVVIQHRSMPLYPVSAAAATANHADLMLAPSEQAGWLSEGHLAGCVICTGAKALITGGKPRYFSNSGGGRDSTELFRIVWTDHQGPGTETLYSWPYLWLDDQRDTLTRLHTALVYGATQ